MIFIFVIKYVSKKIVKKIQLLFFISFLGALLSFSPAITAATKNDSVASLLLQLRGDQQSGLVGLSNRLEELKAKLSGLSDQLQNKSPKDHNTTQKATRPPVSQALTLSFNKKSTEQFNLQDFQIKDEELPFTLNDLKSVIIDWGILSKLTYDSNLKTKSGQELKRPYRYAISEVLKTRSRPFSTQNLPSDFAQNSLKITTQPVDSLVNNYAYRAKLFINNTFLCYYSFFPQNWDHKDLIKSLFDSACRLECFKQDHNTGHWLFYANTSDQYSFDTVLVVAVQKSSDHKSQAHLIDYYPLIRYKEQNALSLINESDFHNRVQAAEQAFRNNHEQLPNRFQEDTLDPDPFMYRSHVIDKYLLEKKYNFSNTVIQEISKKNNDSSINNTCLRLRNKRISLGLFHVIYPLIEKDSSGNDMISGGHLDYDLYTLRKGYYTTTKVVHQSSHKSQSSYKYRSSGAYNVEQHIGAYKKYKSHFPAHWTDKIFTEIVVTLLKSDFKLPDSSGNEFECTQNPKASVRFNFRFKPTLIRDMSKKRSDLDRQTRDAMKQIDFGIQVVVDITSGFVITAYPFFCPPPETK